MRMATAFLCARCKKPLTNAAVRREIPINAYATRVEVVHAICPNEPGWEVEPFRVGGE